MTIRARFTIVPLLLLSLSLFSCVTVDNSMGSSFIPSNQYLTLQVQDFEAPFYTQMADSLYMGSPTLLGFGSVNTPEFGITSLACAAQITPYALNEEFGIAPYRIEAGYLEIPIGKCYTSNPNDRYIPQNVYVHKLIKDLDAKSAYSGFLSKDVYDPIPISKPGVVYNGTDTLQIDFTEAFCQELLDADSTQRDSLAAFQARYKGLVIRTEPVDSHSYGRLNYFLLSNAYMNIVYRCQDAQADSTLSYAFDSYGLYLNDSKHASQGLVSKEPTSRLFYEGLSGIKPRLDVGKLKESIRQWGQAQDPVVDASRILISRADLIIPVEEPQSGDYTAVDNAPDSLYACYKADNDSINIFTYIPDLGNTASGGVMNRTFWHYSFEITSYLQDALMQKTEWNSLYDLWILGIRPTVDSYYGSTTYKIDNFLYETTPLCGNASSRPPYVRITFAVLQE